MGRGLNQTDVVCVTPTHCLFVWASRGVLSQTLHLHQPQGVIAVGGNVTIQCHHQLLDMRILVYKDEDENYLNYTDPAGSEAEFPITSTRRELGGTYTCRYIYRSGGTAYSEPSDPVQIIVAGCWLAGCSGVSGHPAGSEAEFAITSARREHGGSYTCRYIYRSGGTVYSEPSDPVQIIVTDPSLPRPSISLSPSGVTAPGADVTIQCQGPRWDVRFFLHKAGDLNPQQHMDPAGAAAEFRIPTVGRQHGGNYSCSYRPRSEPFVFSQPSDTVQLVVAEPSYPKPSISVSPGEEVSLGTAVTVRCWGQHPGVWFVLNKEGRHFPPVDSDGLEAEFSTSNVHRDLGGSYTCSYHSRSEPFAVSYPSDPMELVVRDPSLPRPSISLSPTAVTAPGADVTIRCQGQRRDVRFFLHKAGDLNPQQHMDRAGAGAEFRIPTVGRQHGGSYSCSYRPRSEPFVSSQPSDTVQLVVAEPSYPKPSISVSPGEEVSLGTAVTVRCWGQHPGVRFVLNKEGRHFPPVDSDGLEAEFSTSNVHRDLGGSYTCSYHSRSEPFAVSYPSDPMELVVRDPSLPRPSISLSPTGLVASGADVTIRCQGPRWDVRFFLHKAGDLNPQRHMDPAGAEAEFRIPTMGQQHGGNYSCSYRPRSEPFVSSQPSDTVQLVVADAGSIPTGGMDSAQPGAAPAPNRVGRAGPGGSEPPAPLGLTSLIIAGVSAAAAALLLLLLLLPVAFVCYRRTRARKRDAPRPSSTIPLEVLKAPAQQDPIYASIDEGKETEPSLGTDGLTYAELDRQALQAKRGDLVSGCWLAGQSGVSGQSGESGQIPTPGPSISVSPSGVITLGRAVTIRCQCRCEARTLLLYKDGIKIWALDAAGDGGEFTIPSARRKDRGAYSCRSRSRSEPPDWSYPSNIVQITVAGPRLWDCAVRTGRSDCAGVCLTLCPLLTAELSYPKPSISLRPSGGVVLGGAVTVRCWGRHQNMRFLLYKDGNLNALQNAELPGAEFPIHNVSRGDAGSYSCYYHEKLNPFIWSQPSDPVELVVAGREYPKPTIWVSPSKVVALRGNVTIRCVGRYPGMEFVLRKAGHPNPQVWTVRDGTVAEFPIPSVGWEDGGSYICEYHSITDQSRWSYLSDPVKIIVADEGLPRPNISLSLIWLNAPRANATIRCQGQRRDVRFFLHKAGDLNPQRHMDPAGTGAKFRIPSVGRQHGGSYSCSYRPRSEPFVSSYVSSSVELVVAGGTDPIHPGASPAPTRLGSAGPAGSPPERLDFTKANIARLALGAVVLLVLGLILIRFNEPELRKALLTTHDCGQRREQKPQSCSHIRRSVPELCLTCVVENLEWGARPVWQKVTDFVRFDREVFVIDVRTVPMHQRPKGPSASRASWCCSPRRSSSFRSHSGLRLGGAQHCGVGDSTELPPLPMASALTVFLLGCWLAGWSRVSGQGSYPKPSISVSPSGVIPVGGNVTIRCWHQHQNMRFQLYKAGDGNYLSYTDPAGSEAEFPITSARREHGGSYTCRYCYRSGGTVYSEPSDPVQIIVTDPSLPRPSISLSPTGVVALGADITILCQGQRRDVRFFLHKAGDLNPQQHMDPAGAGAEFRIPSVGQQHGGNYSCSYRPRSEPFVSSQPSDTVQLVVAEPSYPKPSISLLSPSGRVSLGGAVSVRCRGQRRGVRFVLNKEGRHFPPVDSDGSEVVFRISNVSREDGGSYSCSYHSRSEPFTVSYPSDPVELVVRDPSLPRPSISLNLTAPRADATIRCQGQRRDVRFFLYKAGDLNPQRRMDRAGDTAEFHIPTVGRQHGGNYSCSYRPQSEPFVSSELSDPVKIIATADFTNTNIARLGLGAGVLLVLGLILAEAYYSRPREGALGVWIRPYGEENLPGGRAASPRGTETTAQTPLPPNTPALENPPQTAPNLTAAPQD
ncbi:immunoglobulin superfamily member 1-like [Gopherus flavomarginatus]|uniref:immunoglobulin superfamily member 1-like n=1 Tax=Gopherus flavomarginatus TaxID=286002 RepID=UPI0021CC1EB7|nr:immunoglobulin superfamily member 1-like [Gopherus flavomarginatus]